MIEEQTVIAWKDKHISAVATDLCVVGVFKKKTLWKHLQLYNLQLNLYTD